jgi:hypothetical protein
VTALCWTNGTQTASALFGHKGEPSNRRALREGSDVWNHSKSIISLCTGRFSTNVDQLIMVRVVQSGAGEILFAGNSEFIPNWSLQQLDPDRELFLAVAPLKR